MADNKVSGDEMSDKEMSGDEISDDEIFGNLIWHLNSTKFFCVPYFFGSLVFSEITTSASVNDKKPWLTEKNRVKEQP